MRHLLNCLTANLHNRRDSSAIIGIYIPDRWTIVTSQFVNKQLLAVYFA